VVQNHDSPPTPPSDDLEENPGDQIQDYGDSFSAFWVQTDSHGTIPVHNYNGSEEVLADKKKLAGWTPPNAQVTGKNVTQVSADIKKGDTVYHYS